MKKTVYLIGGGPTAGKSYIAKALSERLSIPWISTDQIRRIIRKATSKDLKPDLFSWGDYTVAEDFLNKYTADEVIDTEIKEAEAIWPEVKLFIERSSPWDDSFIIEGISILPHLIAKGFDTNKNIKPVFIADDNENKIREIIFKRGLWGPANTYPDSVKEKEVAWALLFSKKLKKEADKYNFPWVEFTKDEDDLSKILKVLG